jgi:hypothetical protein
MATTTKLYRPVGQGELDLFAANGFKSFPPRLPDQPIFYPVRNSTATSMEKFESSQNSSHAQRDERIASADSAGLQFGLSIDN